MSGHTPGFWKVTPFSNDYLVEGPDETTISEADARLIASAPYLLEALQNLENDDGSIPKHAWDMVQNAIKKAIGNKE